MSRALFHFLIVAVVCSWTCPWIAATEITAERSPHGVVVKIDGQLFTEYRTHVGTKPILWPIMGPTGLPMTHECPKDHPHQRSMWFTHGNVNGINFWVESGKSKKKANRKIGSIEHVRFLKVASGKPAVLVSENNWLGPDGQKVCEDQRTLRFDTDGDARWIDFDITIKATDGPVTFQDDKEGTFGIRVAPSMTVDSKQGGQIINSDGKKDTAAWGQAAPWVDYFGPVDGQTVGIAIFNHPTSFRFPTYWHVRTYGLFAANPFGVKTFTNKREPDGTYTIQPGDAITLRYRVFLHRGDSKVGKVAKAYETYVNEVK